MQAKHVDLRINTALEDIWNIGFSSCEDGPGLGVGTKNKRASSYKETHTPSSILAIPLWIFCWLLFYCCGRIGLMEFKEYGLWAFWPKLFQSSLISRTSRVIKTPDCSWNKNSEGIYGFVPHCLCVQDNQRKSMQTNIWGRKWEGKLFCGKWKKNSLFEASLKEKSLNFRGNQLSLSLTRWTS